VDADDVMYELDRVRVEFEGQVERLRNRVDDLEAEARTAKRKLAEVQREVRVVAAR
jgi:hypothetical protein